MEIKKLYKARWFYGFGPNQEMIIDNNQNKIARIFGLSQGVVSACLRGERRGHKGWRFTLIENPQPFVPAEKKKKSVIEKGYASDSCSCRMGSVPSPQKPTPVQKKESDAKHMEVATAAGIRRLMAGLYPQWCGVDSEGYIFTS